MAEQLQSLLERIQKDGVEKADAESQRLIDEATAKAAKIVSDAEAEARRKLEQAEQDGQAFAERGRVSLEQAARDVVISVGEALNRALKEIASADIKQSLDANTVGNMLQHLVEAYAQSASGTQRVDVLLPEDRQKEVTDYLMSRFAENMREGLTIKPDSSLVSGFRVSMVDDEIEHDFTEDAITTALCELVRPHIADIVKNALGGKAE